MKDYYRILNVDKDDSFEIIKKKYHRKALKYHPDKNGNTSSSIKKFNLICEAYSILSDPYKRGRYDVEYESFDRRNLFMNTNFNKNKFFKDSVFDMEGFKKSLPTKGLKTYSYSSSKINRDGTIETKVKTNINGKKDGYYKKEIIDNSGNKNIIIEKGNKKLIYDKFGNLLRLKNY